MSEVFIKRLNALIERDGKKATAEFYGVSTSTLSRWQQGGTPRDDSIRKRVVTNGKRITGKAIKVRDTQTGKFQYSQFKKQETELLEDAFETDILDKRQEGLFKEVFQKTESRLKIDVLDAITERQKIRAQTKLDDYTEVKEERFRKLAELYNLAKESNNDDDWRDYRSAYATVTGNALRKQDREYYERNERENPFS